MKPFALLLSLLYCGFAVMGPVLHEVLCPIDGAIARLASAGEADPSCHCGHHHRKAQPPASVAGHPAEKHVVKNHLVPGIVLQSHCDGDCAISVVEDLTDYISGDTAGSEDRSWGPLVIPTSSRALQSCVLTHSRGPPLV
ncbi:MAG: hypothetical protein AAF958_09225 [Planctomycetota bacterium]